MEKEQQQLLVLMFLIGFAYAGLDPNEANRMRMELMGVFWLLSSRWVISPLFRSTNLAKKATTPP